MSATARYVLFDRGGIIAEGPEDEVRAELASILAGTPPNDHLLRVGDLILARIEEVHG